MACVGMEKFHCRHMSVGISVLAEHQAAIVYLLSSTKLHVTQSSVMLLLYPPSIPYDGLESIPLFQETSFDMSNVL